MQLAELCQFTKGCSTQDSCLAGTSQMKPSGVETEETNDGYLVIHHGQRKKTCARGPNGAEVVLSPRACAAWVLGGSKSSHGGDCRAPTTKVQLVGGKTWAVGTGYAPSSGRSSAERQVFCGAVVKGIGNDGRRNAVSYYLDAGASVGIGEHTRYRHAGAPCSQRPYGSSAK